jgi:hypothetical protein
VKDAFWHRFRAKTYKTCETFTEAASPAGVPTRENLAKLQNLG